MSSGSEQRGFVFSVVFIIVFSALLSSIPAGLQGSGEDPDTVSLLTLAYSLDLLRQRTTTPIILLGAVRYIIMIIQRLVPLVGMNGAARQMILAFLHLVRKSIGFSCGLGRLIFANLSLLLVRIGAQRYTSQT